MGKIQSKKGGLYFRHSATDTWQYLELPFWNSSLRYVGAVLFHGFFSSYAYAGDSVYISSCCIWTVDQEWQ